MKITIILKRTKLISNDKKMNCYVVMIYIASEGMPGLEPKRGGEILHVAMSRRNLAHNNISRYKKDKMKNFSDYELEEHKQKITLQ